ncbi:trypsin-like serine protease [Aspergillus carlsbadensis]|nr:trypsin-like serine protease [Aspergillus carlsbadensis]
MPLALARKRIIGGPEVAIEDYPYQVNILVYGTFSGGGSIIDETHILTAAHCVSGSPTEAYTVHAGSSLWASGGREVNISTITKHPDFRKPVAQANDLAILTLAENLTFGPSIQPIALPSLHGSDSESRLDPSSALVTGQEIVVSGWGDTGEGKGMSSTLHAVNEEIIEREKCAAAYGEYNLRVTDAMFCAGAPGGGKGACQGDSGGPGVTDGVLVGVVSWGYYCGRQGYPGVFTRVAYYRDWIAQVIGV